MLIEQVHRIRFDARAVLRRRAPQSGGQRRGDFAAAAGANLHFTMMFGDFDRGQRQIKRLTHFDAIGFDAGQVGPATALNDRMKLGPIWPAHGEQRRPAMTGLASGLFPGGDPLATGNHRFFVEPVARRRFRAVVALHQELALQILILGSQLRKLPLQDVDIILSLRRKLFAYIL